jgi:hypothetical protein
MSMIPKALQGKQVAQGISTISPGKPISNTFGRQASEYTQRHEKGELLPFGKLQAATPSLNPTTK